jgi:hypothetical protein
VGNLDDFNKFISSLNWKQFSLLMEHLHQVVSAPPPNKPVRIKVGRLPKIASADSIEVLEAHEPVPVFVTQPHKAKKTNPPETSPGPGPHAPSFRLKKVRKP